MSERITGDAEIIDALGRRYANVPGSAIDPAAMPAVLMALHGFTNIASVAPKPVGSVTPAAQWTGTTGDGLTVTIKLWQDPRYDPVALAAALAAEQG